MKTKAILAVVAAATIAGVGSVLAQPKAAIRSAPKTAPIKFANDVFVPAIGHIESLAVAGQQFGPALLTLGAAVRSDNRFSNDVDTNVTRTPNSQPGSLPKHRH